MIARPIAIVTDALWRKSLSAIRSLGAAGYRVFALGDSRLTTGFYSRYVSRRFIGPSAATDPDGFGAALARAVDAAHGQPAAILPMEDASCEWLLARGGGLPASARWLLPAQEAFAVARDKARTFETAMRLGLPCPETYAPHTAEDLRSLLGELPLERFVVKPRIGTGSAGVIYGADIAGVQLDVHWATHGPLLLQQRVPPAGAALGVSLLYDDGGRARAAFAHRRLREYPVTGGPSTQRVSIPLDGLGEQSRQLLEGLSWSGVAMVEWKVDPDSGRPLLLEINPRFWGSLALAVRAGVDFPAWYADAALGRPLPSVPPDYPAGVLTRWMWPGEVLRYLGTPAADRESLRAFLHGALHDSEEFDRRDLSGSVASLLCQGLLALNPTYWRYLKRH